MLTAADHALFEFARRNDSVFALDHAVDAGRTPDQIRKRAAHLWERIHEGVFRVPGAASTWRSELRAAIWAAGDGAAISHRSAAALYELPRGRNDLVELTCRRWLRSTRPGLRVHESRRLDERDIRTRDGIRVTTPERCVLDLASLFPQADYLERVVHAARRKRLITYGSTKAVFDRHARRGLKGVSALREVLEAWDPNTRPTESDMETLLLQVMRKNCLDEPVLQFEVRDAGNRLVARPDAAYPATRIAIEYDSDQEHLDEFQVARDATRRNALQAAGWVVLSVRRRDLQSGGGAFCNQIRTILQRKVESA